MRHEPTAQKLHAKIFMAVAEHWNAMPEQDATHPLLKFRNHKPLISGSWSVRLTDSGFHVPHIHPEGILSSASYWTLPPSTENGDGHLEIGRPPPDLNVQLGPVTTLSPKAGHLALFPSSLYHGTTPFNQGERITAAFDVVPS